MRGTQNLVRGFVVPLFILCGSALAAAPADEIKNLAVSGASTLALKLLQQTEPKRDIDPAAWMQWQQQKIAIYQQQQKWDQIVRELGGLQTEDLPFEFRSWCWTQIAHAYLVTDRGEEARMLLTPVIWSGSDLPAPMLQTWRRMLVESYLSEERVVDAYTAMLRYRQDYPEDKAADWMIIQARTLLVNDRATEAVSLLKDVDDSHAEVIAAIAKHRLGETLDAKSMASLLIKLRDPGLSFELRQQLFNALVGQADLLQAGLQQIELLEQIVIAATDVAGIESSQAVDRLWRAYQEYGNQLANQSQLLVGDFEPWFDVIQRQAASSSLQSRALLSVIATSDDKNSAQKAHSQFSHLLTMKDRDKALLKPLYLGSSRTMDINSLPESVLYLLIDQALNEGDQASAARLMNSIQAAGATQTIDWRLRRARSQVLAGVAPVGADIAKEMLHGGQSLDRAQFDYLIRIDFDLQRIGQLEAAFELFSLMLNEAPELSVRRELLFWMADIRVAQKKFDEAARLYFQAADVIKADAQDLSPQMARQQAAQALVKAGYIDDARQVYEHLLQEVEAPEQRAVLQRELQQLQLFARHN